MFKFFNFLKIFIFIFAIGEISHSEEIKQDKYIRKVLNKRKKEKIINNNSKIKVFLKEKQKQEDEEKENIRKWKKFEDSLEKEEFELNINEDNSGKYTNENNKQKNDSKFYLQAGIGTTGFYTNISLYYLDLIGVRAEYSYAPNLSPSFITKLLQKAEERISGSSIKLRHSYGLDVSIRPFAMISKPLSGFRIDIGFRKMDAGFYIDVTQGVNINIKNKINNIAKDKGLNGEGLNIIANNILQAHGLDNLFTGDAKLIIPVNIARGIKPYFGIGFDADVISGLYLSFSFGVIVSQFKYDNVRIQYQGKDSSYYTDIIDTYLNELYQISEKHDDHVIKKDGVDYLKDKFYELYNDLIDDYKKQATAFNISVVPVYPVIQFGIGWQFNLE